MAITKSAKKAARAAERRQVFNARRKKAMKDVLKELSKLTGAKETSAANALLPKAYKAIDKAAKRGVLKPNTAARIKSRISKRLGAVAV